MLVKLQFAILGSLAFAVAVGASVRLVDTRQAPICAPTAQTSLSDQNAQTEAFQKPIIDALKSLQGTPKL